MHDPMEDGDRSTRRYLILRQFSMVGPAPKTGPSWSEEIVSYFRAATELQDLAPVPDLRRLVERELALLEYENHVSVAHLEGPTQYRVTSEGRVHFHELVRSRPPVAYAPIP